MNRRHPSDPAESLAGLYARLGPRLYRYALAILSSPQDAEEIVQDLLVAFAETSERPQDPAAYLIRATRNAALKQMGRARRRRELLKERQVLLVPREPGDPALDDLARRASEALKDLPLEQREALALHLFEGMTFQEIGEATGVSPDTAASRYRYGIGKLKEVLDHERS